MEKILLSPGPVALSPAVREQLGRHMTHHRSKEIKQALSRLQSSFQKIFKTKEHIYILNSSGTGAMEAALTNTLSPKDEVLVISAGKFGQRWKELALAYKLTPHEIKAPWGEAVNVSEVKEKLKSHPQIKAVLVQACETSTAVNHPIKELASLTKNLSQTLLIVDAISALMMMDLDMDDYGIDILIGGSQKSFALPTGMSFLSLSKKAQEFQKTSSLPVYYFDLTKELKSNQKGETAFSANVSFIRALDASLQEYLKQGFSEIRKKAKTLAQATEEFSKHLNLKLFSSAPSLTVTAISMPENIDGNQVKKFMEEQNIIVGGGQDILRGKIVRFGHIGHIQFKDYATALNVFGKALQKQQPEIYTEELLKTAQKKTEEILNK
ncbi:MAG: alanine--glyoxylate aminotransferase family protein [Bdellovibrionales bacterium]|nr:alanine--glyoxylate aminotransferase family protein [Bdellovibrionales bacterium]